jgi:hypothetical protein
MSSPAFIILKLLLTSTIIVLVSELVKISGKAGALVAALPTVTILVLIWMQVEGQPQEKIASHAWYTLWYVIPTLPMFALFPYVYAKLGFWNALAVSAIVTIMCFGLFALALRKFGIDLL